jgi:hypothetical protein
MPLEHFTVHDEERNIKRIIPHLRDVLIQHMSPTAHGELEKQLRQSPPLHRVTCFARRSTGSASRLMTSSRERTTFKSPLIRNVVGRTWWLPSSVEEVREKSVVLVHEMTNQGELAACIVLTGVCIGLST